MTPKSTISKNEAIDIAKAYGIDAPKTKTAFSLNEAIRFAEEIGYPIVMKITSPDLIHKSDFGGVAIGVKDPDELKTRFTTMMTNARKYAPHSKVIGMDMRSGTCEQG